jgi:hypothetical protein
MMTNVHVSLLRQANYMIEPIMIKSVHFVAIAMQTAVVNRKTT